LLEHVAIAASLTPGATAKMTGEETPLTARRVPMDAASVHASLWRVPGATRDWVLRLGFGLLDRVARKGPLLSTAWRVDLPVEPAADLVACIEAARLALEAQVAQVQDSAADRQLGPSARMARTLWQQGERLPDWLGLLALLEECVWVWDAPEAMPRRPYEAIYRRDGYRCMAPGCTGRVRLEVHHVQYRSQGGDEGGTNLLTLCRFHHQQGEHGLLARCRGKAPLGIVWRLGHAGLATWWRNEMRLTPRPSREGQSVAAVLDELGREAAAP
jgi:hypothetical protein